MAQWALTMDDMFPECVELVLSHPASLDDQGNFLMRLDDAEVVSKYPSERIKLLLYLMGNSEAIGHYAYYLAQVVQSLKAEVGAQAVEPLIEAALELGCTGAHSWLDAEEP